jgi:hypothetical protein
MHVNDHRIAYNNSVLKLVQNWSWRQLARGIQARIAELANRVVREHDHFTITRNGRADVMLISVARVVHQALEPAHVSVWISRRDRGWLPQTPPSPSGPAGRGITNPAFPSSDPMVASHGHSLFASRDRVIMVRLGLRLALAACSRL